MLYGPSGRPHTPLVCATLLLLTALPTKIYPRLLAMISPPNRREALLQGGGHLLAFGASPPGFSYFIAVQHVLPAWPLFAAFLRLPIRGCLPKSRL